ncbi:hypothetical protein THRCLA_08685 [Thraustotheca clavata]|uniref:Uncharacterized protein n=1 Tax=Thraustotheca clavata TaxID=74557 RepID=A0A1V9Z3F1_9STRA|nr:hypothetical protein THRCLA_08685 [Thraustotheca clavata]
MSSPKNEAPPPPLPLLIPTPRTSDPLDTIGNDTWLFSPPSLRRPSQSRNSSIAAYFQALPPLQKTQRYPEPDAKESRRPRQYRVPFVLFTCFCVFAIVAGVLVFGSSSNDNSTQANRPEPRENITNSPTITTPAPTGVLEMDQIKDATSGIGNGTNIEWKEARYYFVNQCNRSLHIYQKPLNMSKWGFCDLPINSYGCASNESGTSYDTPDGGYDQATLFEITIVPTTGVVSYDISIIPPGCRHEMSLEKCKEQSGKIGFNLPMKVVPLKSSCAPLICLADGCPDAYQYPDENNKTHTCAVPNIVFQVTFCPL